MESKDIKDKSKKNHKIIIAIVLILFVAFILVRIIAIKQNEENPLIVQEPDLNQIEIEGGKTKAEKFEEEKVKLEDAQFQNNDNEPKQVFLNLSSAFKADTPVTKKIVDVTENSSSLNNEQYVAVNEKKTTNKIKSKNITNDLEDSYMAVRKSTKKEEIKEVNKENEPVIIAKKSPFGTSFTQNFNEKNNSSVNKKDVYKCFLHSSQKLENGTGVIFRAVEDIYTEKRIIKKNSLLYGISLYNKKRIMIEINKVKGPDGEYAVKLEVLDNDYVKGIYFRNAYDNASEKSSDDITDDVGNAAGNGVLGKATKAVLAVAKNASTAVKEDRSLHLKEGYIIYVKETQ